MEWDAVYVLNVVDGAFPSEFAAGKPELIEDDRRLLYVAMTRARDDLLLMTPQRFPLANQSRTGDTPAIRRPQPFLHGEGSEVLRLAWLRGSGLNE